MDIGVLRVVARRQRYLHHGFDIAERLSGQVVQCVAVMAYACVHVYTCGNTIKCLHGYFHYVNIQVMKCAFGVCIRLAC